MATRYRSGTARQRGKEILAIGEVLVKMERELHAFGRQIKSPSVKKFASKFEELLGEGWLDTEKMYRSCAKKT